MHQAANISHLTDHFGELSVNEMNELMKVQKNILEAVITGNDYQVILNSLCHAIEELVPDALSSILLYNDTRTALETRAAPSMPKEAIQQLNNLVPGENSGSCGTAVYRQTPQFICDTSNDVRWAEFQEFIRDFNIHACWSMPIFNPKNKVIGSFALSSFEIRKPNNFQKNILKTAAKLVSLVLLREQDDLMLYQAAHFDSLTGLANRPLFNSRLEHAIAKVNRSKKILAVYFIDLDKFKQINDEFGHDIGDIVLQKLSERMSSQVRSEDTLARLGGDEFVLLVESASTRDELILIGNKLQKTFEQPINIEGKTFSVAASVGVSIYPEDGLTSNLLLRNADLAMYKAKSSSEAKVNFFSLDNDKP